MSVTDSVASPFLPSHGPSSSRKSDLSKPSEANKTPTVEQAEPNRVYCVGQFGLGHRLSKLSAAHHLAESVLQVPLLEVHWGSCQTGETDVFPYLFGTHLLPIGNTTRTQTTAGKTILVRNDVEGYYAGQAYKNAQVAIPRHYATSTQSPWRHKLQTDRLLFQNLLDRFLKRHSPRDFFEALDWHNRTVMGLHLRAGNGEQHHFQTAGRSVQNTTVFVQNLCQLLSEKFLLPPNTTKPLLFVATDTPALIPVLQQACVGTQVAVRSQPRLNAGVSYSAWKNGDACFEGWRASMMDMALLAHADVLIAGMRSTFTQILPLSVVLGRKQSRSRQYCEVAVTGRTMTCFTDQTAWLFRNHAPQQQQRTFSLDDAPRPVVHKTLVHLPDLEPSVLMDQAVKFLTSTGNQTVFAYGNRFDTKYRGKYRFREEWTWEET